jgi:hypothetical protein
MLPMPHGHQRRPVEGFLSATLGGPDRGGKVRKARHRHGRDRDRDREVDAAGCPVDLDPEQPVGTALGPATLGRGHRGGIPATLRLRPVRWCW